MIQISTLHHKSAEGNKFVRSHKLTPHDAVTLFCIIEGDKENIVSILEDHLLEMISGVEWQEHDMETDFSYVAEHFNHFIKNLESNDLAGVSMIFASLFRETLLLSVIGHARAILVEKNGEINTISTEELGRYEFHAISSGNIPAGGNIYLANAPIEAILGDDILLEFSELDTHTWIKTAENVLSREYHENLHIIRVDHEQVRSPRLPLSSGQVSIIREKGAALFTNISKILPNTHWKSWLEKIPTDSKKMQYGFLISGIVLLFILAYSLMSAISGIIHTTSTDSKNQLLQAQSLIEQGQKLTNNPIAFNKNIKEAEKILFSLRDKKEHMADTQNLLGRIEAMKKEVNDVQTIDMSKYTSVMKFNPNDISPIGVFEKNKKLTLIGRAGVIMDHAKDSPLPKVLPFPTGEEAISYDMEDDGNFYILTKNGRILAPRRNELTYVTVSGQDGWEKAKILKTFNGNIYLISDDAHKIFKHKPGMNGFSAKTAVLETNPPNNILDLGIDGGLYILMQDGKINRFITGKTDSPKSIVINKVPGEYDIGQASPTSLFTRSNLAYVYILSGDRIWIFQPDSKRFQDVAALTYVAQLEIQTQEEIRNIYVPRDGTIDVVTNLGVYELGFEIADGKIILR